jgi:hypothetical protein
MTILTLDSRRARGVADGVGIQEVVQRALPPHLRAE